MATVEETSDTRGKKRRGRSILTLTGAVGMLAGGLALAGYVAASRSDHAVAPGLAGDGAQAETPSITSSVTPSPIAAPPTSGRLVLGPETALGAPTPTVTPIKENDGLSPQMADLLAALSSELEGYAQLVGGIDVGVAVTDLQTGETLSINGNSLHRTGCTINLFALLAATDLFQSGVADPGDVWYSVRTGIGSSYPPEVKWLMETLFGSHEAGVARAQELMRAWGLQTAVFDHVPYYGDGSQNNYLTALEANLTLSKLYRGELFDPDWTAYALNRLRDVDYNLNYMLPGWLPAEADVAHKIGYHWDDDGWVNNDAGIVTFSAGDGQTRAYTISYFSQKASTESIGNYLGARLSAVTWNHFATTYGVSAQADQPQPYSPEPPTPPAETPAPLLPSPSPSPVPSPIPSTTPSPIPSPIPSTTPSPTPSPAPLPSPTPSQTP